MDLRVVSWLVTYNGAAMNLQSQLWMPAILALFGSLIVVVITAWLNTKALTAQIEAVRAEMMAVRAEMMAVRAEMMGQMDSLRAEVKGNIESLRAEVKQGFAELRLEFHKEISELSHRVERLEEQRGLVRP